MKTIGLLGGMSAESSGLYYRLINDLARERLGGMHSAPVLMHSFDFAELEADQRRGDWSGLARKLTRAAQGLQSIGAELMLMRFRRAFESRFCTLSTRPHEALKHPS